jgi:hypothetical protein
MDGQRKPQQQEEMLRGLLWSHTRNINAFIYASRVVYDIPIYNDAVLARVRSVKIEHGSIVLEMEREKQNATLDIHDAPTDEGHKGTDCENVGRRQKPHRNS